MRNSAGLFYDVFAGCNSDREIDGVVGDSTSLQIVVRIIRVYALHGLPIQVAIALPLLGHLGAGEHLVSGR